MKLLRRLTITLNHTLNIMAIFAGILLIFMTLQMGWAVISRYLLGRPLGWVIEISEYILVYIAFLVPAWVLREEGHVKMDLVLNRLSPRNQHLINTITSAICAIACFILTWFGAKVTWHYYQTGYFTPTILAPPQCIFLAIVVVGFFLLAIQFVRRSYTSLMRWRASPDKETKL